MSSETQIVETFDETEAPIPLSRLIDVERALAKVIRQVRKGSIELPTAHCLVIALGTLAKMKRENRIEEAVKRLEALEEARTH